MATKARLNLKVTGMTCAQCEKIIQKSLKGHEGVFHASVSYKTNQVEIIYDPSLISRDGLVAIIEHCGYEAKSFNSKKADKEQTSLQTVGIAVFLVALYLIISNTIGFNTLPEVQATMGYGMLFVVGLLTSIHCIAMCGGINLSQCIQLIATEGPRSVYQSSLLYNSGRVISYTLVGAIVGALGSVISFSGPAKGLVALFAGVFMIIMGINMMGLIPSLKKYNLQLPSGLRQLFLGKNQQRGPFIVGLLNGLMPCGPLQTMQLYALGTGSALTGALSMLAFSLGTVPLMFGFGAISSMMSRNLTKTMMKISAMLVIVMGMVMFQRGAALSGISLEAYEANPVVAEEVVSEVEVVDGVQELNLEVKPNRYPEFTIKANIPARINFHVAEGNLNGCNNTILIPAYGIEKPLEVGENWVEFTPDKSGKVPYSCWMGMISSQITVVE